MGFPVVNTPKFFIPLPLGNDWNRLHPAAVIEAVEELPGRNSALVHLKVLAPDSFAKKYPRVARLVFTECAGPARELDEDEYMHLLDPLKSKTLLLKEFKSEQSIPNPSCLSNHQ